MTAADALRVYGEAPARLRTAGQLRGLGLRPGGHAVAWWEQLFAGDRWRTELYDVHAALPLDQGAPQEADAGRPAAEPPAQAASRSVMKVVTWTRPVNTEVDGRWADTGRRAPLKIHVSQDGERTACGSAVPQDVSVVAVTADWHLHTTCYNCAYRLWGDHGPADYICPINGSDFPIRRRTGRYNPLPPNAAPAPEQPW